MPRKATRAEIELLKPVKALDKSTEAFNQAVTTIKGLVSSNDAFLLSLLEKTSPQSRPVRFDIKRDRMGNMTSIIPIYEDS